MTLKISDDSYLMHYGVLRKSGRYPYGSGGPEASGNKNFLGYVDQLKKGGMSDTDIVKTMGLSSTTELRAAKSIAKNEEKAALIAQAQRMKEHGMSNTAIGERLGKNESTVRSLLAPGASDKARVLNSTAEMLKSQVDEKGVIDIGTGVEQHVGVSRTRMDTAIAALKEQGYYNTTVQVPQANNPNNKTNIKVLAKPGSTYRDIASNLESIQQIDVVTGDMGRTYGEKIGHPISIDPARVKVRYAEDGGTAADGVIYLRPGVKDLDLQGSSYAQVRITVGDKHYLKGMAMYKKDLPDGVDIEFNTNKSDKGDKLKALKEMKTVKDEKGNMVVDLDNPFGASISRQKGALNIVNEEGEWDKWSRNFSTQMLSKQSPTLAKQQLDLTYENKKADLDEIKSLTNPQVRKKLLETYADGADSSAVHMKAASLPRSASHVILPFDKLKETEIYAPNYRDGERVALIRYPHGGKFEIPELVVNNKHRPAIEAIGRAKDAVGINSKVAERLSGADFDGDTVLVIPNNSGKVKSEPALQALKGFDPQRAYPAYDGMPTMSGGTYNASTGKVDYPKGKGPSGRIKQQQMGYVSNLITDMTLMGAPNHEVARAVKHSMVVIDAEKHNLNYKQSAIENGISGLMTKYQGKAGGGAATLISRATARQDVRARKRQPIIDKATGKKTFVEEEGWIDAEGNQRYRMQRSQKLAETDDARTLISAQNTRIENVYASHSNRMKALANDARREMVNTVSVPYSESARKAYAPEVSSLSGKLNIALKNRPLERQAQLLAGVTIKAKLDSQPDLDDAEIKKLKSNELRRARERVGAGKTQVYIEDNEWAAIQAGSVSKTRLDEILQNADLDRVRELSMPRTRVGVTPAKEARARSMAELGYSQADIAAQLGISTTTVKELM